MKHTLRITILVVLFCAAAVQSWANFPNPTITKGDINGGTVKIYAQDPTTNTSQVEITDAPAGNTVYLVAEADYQHISAGIDWRVMKSGRSSVAQSRTRSVDYAEEITVTKRAGNVYSFTMPTGGESVTVSATFAGKPTAQTTYIDPTKPAGQQECSATAYILDGTEQSIGADGKTTWYVCNSDVTYESSIKIHGPIHLILADGKTMSVGNSNAEYGIKGDNDASLTVYGQSLGTGKLIAKANNDVILLPGNFTLIGGNIFAVGDTGINTDGDVTILGGVLDVTGNYVGVSCKDNFTFNGGKVTAIGGSFGGIHSYIGDIVLGFTNPDDYIYASSYKCGDGSVKTAAGKRFVAYRTEKSPGNEGFDPNATITAASAIIGDAASTAATAVSADISLDDAASTKTIAGKTLRPLAVAEPDGQGGTTVSPGYLLSINPGNITPTDKTAPDFILRSTPYYIYKAGGDGVTIPVSVPNYGQTGADFTVSIDGAADTSLPDAAVSGSDGLATAALPWTGANDVELKSARYYCTGVKYLKWDDAEHPNVEYTTPTAANNTTKVYILTGNETTSLPEGWYMVKNWNTDESVNSGSDAFYTSPVTFTGDTHLILADDARMDFGTATTPSTGNGIKFTGCNLAIYAQSIDENMGQLNIFSNILYSGFYSPSFSTATSLTINGGNISCTVNKGAGIQILSTDLSHGITINGGNFFCGGIDGSGIYAYSSDGDASVSINGGNITVKGDNMYRGIEVNSFAKSSVTINNGFVDLNVIKPGIEVNSEAYFSGGSTLAIYGGIVNVNSEYGFYVYSEYGVSDIILGWKNLSDYIYSPKYDVEGDISIASGQYLLAADKIHGTGPAYSGNAFTNNTALINGKYLQPAIYSVIAPDRVILNVTDGDNEVKSVPAHNGENHIPYYIYKDGLTVSASLTNEAMQADFTFKNKQGDDLQGDFTTRDLQGTTATVTIDGSSPAASITEVIAVSFTLPDDDVVIATSNVGVPSGGSQYLAFVDNGGNIKTTDGNVVILVFKGLQNNPTTGAIEAIFEEVDEVPEDLPVIFANKTDGSSLPATIPVAEDNSDAANTLAENIRSNASPFFMTGAAGNLLKDILKAALTDADGKPLTNGSGYTLSQEFSDYVYFVFTGDKFVATSASAASTLSARRYILAIDKVTLLKLLNGSGSPAPARAASSTSRVWTFPVMVGGNSNGITNLTIDTDSPDNGNWYSIDGRRLNTAPRTKGVYIHKDKVVVVKY